MKKELIIFNLETNLDSPVLAAAHDWVESFSKEFDRVKVYSTHVGRFALPMHVEVSEIGGGSILTRLTALVRLLRVGMASVNSKGDIVVLHHMSTYSAVISGPIFRLFGIKQGLWYSHSIKSISLVVASRFVDVIFSSSPDALPLKSSKNVFVGHGINLERFKRIVNSERNRTGIVSLGRYAPVKNYERYLELASEFKELKFDIYGPTGLPEYRDELVNTFESKNPNVKLLGSVNYLQVPNLLSRYEYFYSGTPKSVDKAAIEAALSGCFILSVNPATVEVSGMGEVWNHMGIKSPKDISNQIRELQFTCLDRDQLRELLVMSAQRRNNLESLTSQISESLSQ
jgi:glycosyltransferase involved in cell wall biosynthesis